MASMTTAPCAHLNSSLPSRSPLRSHPQAGLHNIPCLSGCSSLPQRVVSSLHPVSITTRLRLVRCAAKPSQESSTEIRSAVSWPSALGLLAWAAFAGYAFLLSPNQTPTLDTYYLKKLSGLAGNDGFTMNPIFEQLFFIMGIWPAIYAALLIPGGRSGNKVPAWPFVSLSFGLGYFALGPYFAAWTPLPETDVTSLSPKDEEKRFARYARTALESPITLVFLLGSLAVLLTRAATAGPEAWSTYFRMFDESRFVHVTSLDFVFLTLLAPFWVLNDASKRQWSQRRSIPALALACLPLVGPALYLALRPRAE